VTCGQLEHGFTRLRCSTCQRELLLPFSCKTKICPSCCAREMHDTTAHLLEHVLPDVPLRQWIVSPPFELRGLLAARGEVLATFVRIFVEAVFTAQKKAAAALGLEQAQCGGIAFIQRFTKTLIVQPHIHLVGLDGVYVKRAEEEPTFHPLGPPSPAQVLEVATEVYSRMKAYLEQEGYLDPEKVQPTTPLDRWFLGAAREPTGLSPSASRTATSYEEAKAGGFSVHAGVSVRDTDGRERLLKYVTRPPFAEEQLEEMKDGRIRFHLRRTANNGQRSIVLEPLAFLRRLAWLVPPPRQHQRRFYGVLAPNAALRRAVIPRPPIRLAFAPQLLPPEIDTKPKRIPWAMLLRKTYDIDSLRCECGGRLVPIAVVMESKAIRDILGHVGLRPRQPRAPPNQLSLGFD